MRTHPLDALVWEEIRRHLLHPELLMRAETTVRHGASRLGLPTQIPEPYPARAPPLPPDAHPAVGDDVTGCCWHLPRPSSLEAVNDGAHGQRRRGHGLLDRTLEPRDLVGHLIDFG